MKETENAMNSAFCQTKLMSGYLISLMEREDAEMETMKSMHLLLLVQQHSKTSNEF